MPVLSGIRAQLAGNELQLTGSDTDLTIHVSVAVNGESDGLVVLPGRLAAEIVRALPARRGGGRHRRRRGAHHLGPAPSSPSASCPPRSTRGCPSRPATRSRCPPRTSRPRCSRWCPAASSDDARPILTGVLLAAEERRPAAGRHRLVPAVGARPARRGGARRGPARARAEPRAVRARTGCSAGADTVELRLGERDASFEVGSIRLTTRLIEGEFPNYRGLIPSSYPNRLTVGREALLEAVRRVKLMAREATPVRMVMRSDGLELVAITQDVGQAHEELDAKYEGTELTVAFNPEYLLDGIEVTPGDEVVVDHARRARSRR